MKLTGILLVLGALCGCASNANTEIELPVAVKVVNEHFYPVTIYINEPMTMRLGYVEGLTTNYLHFSPSRAGGTGHVSLSLRALVTGETWVSDPTPVSSGYMELHVQARMAQSYLAAFPRPSR